MVIACSAYWVAVNTTTAAVLSYMYLYRGVVCVQLMSSAQQLHRVEHHGIPCDCKYSVLVVAPGSSHVLHLLLLPLLPQIIKLEMWAREEAVLTDTLSDVEEKVSLPSFDTLTLTISPSHPHPPSFSLVGCMCALVRKLFLSM